MSAKWVGFNSDTVHTDIGAKDVFGCYAQYYRKAFNLTEKPIKATAKISALGIFVAFINGKKVSEEYFAPGWTNYNKTILYREYDITALLQDKNAISICVGEGWYAGFLSILGRFRYGKHPLSIFAELKFTFADGSTKTVDTDDTWLAGLGAIRENDFLGGEIYDSRLPHEQTSLYGFDDSGWDKVEYTEDKSDKLTFIDYEPILPQEKLSANLISKKENVLIYDFNQNFAGLVRIKVKGASGSQVVMRYAEILDDDGNVYVKNLRLAKATDYLILNGDVVDYIPTHTYHGFRYAEITLPDGAELISVEGVALYNNIKMTGQIQTSHPIANKLLSNVLWGMKSNFVDLPTDCPQRNERLGWSGDTQVFTCTANYFADCNKFYKKHIHCINDDRRDGQIPDVVPYFGVAPFDSTGWRDVAVVVPYYLWRFYGDREYALSCLPLVDAMLNRQRETAVDFTWQKANYNDWLNVDEDVVPSVLTALSNAHCFMLAIKLKEELGVPCENDKEFFNNIKSTFIKNFVSENDKIEGDTLTAYALAYRVGFISKENAKAHILTALKKRDYHIHSGFIGIRFILPALAELGLADICYDLVTKTTYPSWGYSIANGATTIWERWNSYTKENGIMEGDGMNSFNHYSFGSCGEWFFEYALGIKPILPTFKKVSIKPYVDKGGKLDFVKGHYDSVSGKISVEWKKVDGAFECEIVKPSTIEAEFAFDGITKIVQDGKQVDSFDSTAHCTKVYFKG